MRILYVPIVMLFCASFHSVLAQVNSTKKCNCAKEFNFLTEHLENSYSGFQDKVTNDNIEEYNTFKQTISRKSKTISLIGNCVDVLNKYISYFRDGHIQIFNDLGPIENKYLYPNRNSCKPDYEPFSNGFKKLTKQTVYLKIGTFSERVGNEIDSLLKYHKKEIVVSKNIIIDIRGNSGGAVFTFQPLLPYLELDSITHIGFDVLASSDNIKAYEEQLNNSYIPQNQKSFLLAQIKRMKENIGKFVSLSQDYSQLLIQEERKQRKIVILIDNNCASTAEHFLIAARQSENVTILGEPTLGMYDYGDMRGFNFPEIPYKLFCATNRSRRLDSGKGIDNTGVQPDIYLNRNKSWIKESLVFLEKKP